MTTLRIHLNGEPREVEIDRSAVKFEEMLEEYDGLLAEVREA